MFDFSDALTAAGAGGAVTLLTGVLGGVRLSTKYRQALPMETPERPEVPGEPKVIEVASKSDRTPVAAGGA